VVVLVGSWKAILIAVVFRWGRAKAAKPAAYVRRRTVGYHSDAVHDVPSSAGGARMLLRTREGFDDDHRCAAVPAHETGAADPVASAWFGDRCRLMQQFAARASSPASGIGEQPVMPDAVDPPGSTCAGAAHELGCGQSHCLVARSALAR